MFNEASWVNVFEWAMGGGSAGEVVTHSSSG